MFSMMFPTYWLYLFTIKLLLALINNFINCFQILSSLGSSLFYSLALHLCLLPLYIFDVIILFLFLFKSRWYSIVFLASFITMTYFVILCAYTFVRGVSFVYWLESPLLILMFLFYLIYLFICFFVMFCICMS